MSSYPKTPLGYARMACDTMMRRYSVNELPPQTYGCATFNYHQGVFLTGMSRIYKICGDERYYNYINDWVHAVQDENGKIREYTGWLTLTTLDFRQASNVLAFMYDQTKDPHYLDLLKYLAESMKDYPVNEYGGFWHFYTTPGQMWLDGLYMAGPMLAHYARLTGKTEFMELAIKQIFIMYENMRDAKTGLLHHGWDPTGQAEWCDPVTKQSPEVWGRACGWFVLAIADMLDDIPEDHPRRAEIIAIQQELVATVLKFQSAEGRWYEVVDKWEKEDNWPENSCTCLFIYSIAKGIRRGYISKEAYPAARRAYDRVIETLLPAAEDEFSMGNICVGTCIEEGTYDYYVHRPTTENDLHGIGAFLLMASEMAKLEISMGL